MTLSPPHARQARRSLERRNILIVNIVLLAVALVFVAPSTARGLVSSIREEADCATVRAVLAKDEAHAIELAPDVDLHDEAAFEALDRQVRAFEAAKLGVLDVHALTKSGHDILEARQRLKVLEDKVDAVKRSSRDIERFNSAYMGKAVERLEALMKICQTDRAARADCLEISRLPDMSLSATNSDAEVRRRFGELQVQHRGKLSLTPTHPAVKKLLAEDIEAETRFIGLMHKLLASFDTLKTDETNEAEIRRTIRGQHARLRQQVAGLRFYCDAPVADAKKAVSR